MEDGLNDGRIGQDEDRQNRNFNDINTLMRMDERKTVGRRDKGQRYKQKDTVWRIDLMMGGKGGSGKDTRG